jgi:ABC-2 type transport system ATP-binding protein
MQEEKIDMNMIEVEHLTKKFKDFKAVDDISFSVGQGEIFGLLGPNGAGKTTTIRCLLTLIQPTSGKLKISDIDLSRHPQQIRQICGYIPQEISVDGDLTGYENLSLYAKLYSVPGEERKMRIKQALEFMQISDRANHLVKTYSGGMMRRLEIGQVLINKPRVLFLDEPSIGLDPIAKHTIRDYIVRLQKEFGSTILLTTHDMFEADQLCDRIGIMNKGKIVIMGSPLELKQKLGHLVVSINALDTEGEIKMLNLGYSLLSRSSNGTIDVITDRRESDIPDILEELKKCGIKTDAVSIKQVTLDDVFLQYAGQSIEESEAEWYSVRSTRTTVKRLGK